jgi:hypothetical protein
LQSIAGKNYPISRLIESEIPLKLAINPLHNDFVIALNSAIGRHVLTSVSKNNKELLMKAFISLSTALAPKVSRLTIMARNYEARISSRLFDADKMVRPFLEERAEELFENIKKDWEWNSRYWEQRALLVVDKDIDTAVSYARHAVAIEPHPFTLTTLSKILFRKMEIVESGARDYFDEGFSCIEKAMGLAARRSRIRIHPYVSIIIGTTRFLEIGNTLTHLQKEKILQIVSDGKELFSSDQLFKSSVDRLYRQF